MSRYPTVSPSRHYLANLASSSPQPPFRNQRPVGASFSLPNTPIATP